MSTVDLIAFLNARLGEDAAEIAKHPDDEFYDPDRFNATAESNYPCTPYLAVGKKYALADIAAKRAIVQEHLPVIGIGYDVQDGKTTWTEPMYGRCHRCEREQFPCKTLRLLTSAYADHPDYREEWRP